MTTTLETPTATATPVTAEVEVLPEGVKRDANGLYVLVQGARIPCNSPGITVLDGTPGEAALQTVIALTGAIDALVAQRDVQKTLIKSVMQDTALATLRGVPVIDWTWGSRTTVDGKIVKAAAPAIWVQAARVTAVRPFSVKKGKV